MFTAQSVHVTFGNQHLISVNTVLTHIVYGTMVVGRSFSRLPQGKVSSTSFNTNEVFCQCIFLSSVDGLRLAGVISNYCFHNVGVVKPFETVTMITGCTNKFDS